VIQVCSYSNKKRGETTVYSGCPCCARAEYVGTYMHTINTYTSYFYHFYTPLQTVNQIIPNFHSLILTFIYSFLNFLSIQFIWSFTISFTHNFDQLDLFTISINPIHLVIHNFDQSNSFGHPQFRLIHTVQSFAIHTEFCRHSVEVRNSLP